ncbi:hypothetical protein [Psychromonas sp. SP041]|uniref:hypothetical protein n=1 Tax=Psychromonas sp. SP041 TaxID=1365007 RepID=UPI000409DCC0|nr:hypothetical protein [Psychromonas sp. SP041]
MTEHANKKINLKDIKNKGFSVLEIPEINKFDSSSLKKTMSAGSGSGEEKAVDGKIVLATTFPFGTLKIAYYRIRDIINNSPLGKLNYFENYEAWIQIITISNNEKFTLSKSSSDSDVEVLFIINSDKQPYWLSSKCNKTVKGSMPLLPGTAVVFKESNNDFTYDLTKGKGKSLAFRLILKKM